MHTEHPPADRLLSKYVKNAIVEQIPVIWENYQFLLESIFHSSFCYDFDFGGKKEIASNQRFSKAALFPVVLKI